MTPVPPGPPFETTEIDGRPVRRFVVAVSAGAMALAWARQDQAPAGAAVVTGREIYPLGRLGIPWTLPAESTLAFAVILRPQLALHLADVVYMLGGLAATEGAEAVTGRHLGSWWPDGVVDTDSGEPVAAIKAEVQLGPGTVRSAVLTMRFDLNGLGIGTAQGDDLVGAVLDALDRGSGWLEQGTEGCAQAVAAYGRRCALLGKRIKVTLLPKGETRGVAQRVDEAAQLEVVSATGMIERISVDMLRGLDVVPGAS
ncbi:MAG: hypothetical protein M3137_11575 [Actinomycetota bacterium]|nr:hypothetical protein [Actinomycetota bacterium]